MKYEIDLVYAPEEEAALAIRSVAIIIKWNNPPNSWPI
jgi:hypothetical protein